MMKLYCLLFLALIGNPDGKRMWLFEFVRTFGRTEMADLGGKVDPVEIYSVNHYSLKDAVVKFSDGTTGGLISNDGLVIAKPYTAGGDIPGKDCIRELPIPGMTVTFMVEMEDVSKVVERAEKRGADSVKKAIGDLTEDAEARQWKSKAVVQDFGDGRYFLISYRTYMDIRLVVDTQSAHPGFSLFRVYADKHNAPAEFSEENRPFRLVKKVGISSTSIQDGEFHMIIGYPDQKMMPVLSLGTAADSTSGLVLDKEGKLAGLSYGDTIHILTQTDILK